MASLPDAGRGPSRTAYPANQANQAYPWRNRNPDLPGAARRCIYAMDIAAYTSEGTFQAARLRLPRMRNLGMNLVELMPVVGTGGEGAGGYFPASPARALGAPEDLCALVDEIHGLGLGALLELDLDQAWDGSTGAALEWALHWLREYRFDGLRLGAVRPGPHRPEGGNSGQAALLAGLARDIRAAMAERRILLYAGLPATGAGLLQAPENPGSGHRGTSDGDWPAVFDGVWADDFQHHLRRRMEGPEGGPFVGFDGSLYGIAGTLLHGRHRPPTGMAPPEGWTGPAGGPSFDRFVFRLEDAHLASARGRLHHHVPADGYRALSALLLLAPQTPLLFMGQEWACTTPYLLRSGEGPGRQEVRALARSRLDWEERRAEPHLSVLHFHRALLRLRAMHPALESSACRDLNVLPQGHAGIICLRRWGGYSLAAVICLASEGGEFRLPPPPGGIAPSGEGAAPIAGAWEERLSSEDQGLVPDQPRPMWIGRDEDGTTVIRFFRAGAWIGDAFDSRRKPEIAPSAMAPRDLSDPSPFVPPALPVLVVEDQEINLRVSRQMLESLGCRVETAAGGREAADLASVRDFSAVLMDCRMPGMDGIQATAAIRSLPGDRGRVPIIAVTAAADADERRRCIDAGMDDFLPKPLRKAALAEVLSRCTRKAQKPGAATSTATGSAAPIIQAPAASEELEVMEEEVATGMPAEALSAGGEEGPFILGHLEKAVSGFGAGNPRFIPELVKLFLKGLPDTVAKLESAAADKDWNRLERSAHALHGAAAQMGAKRLSRLSRDLENSAMAGEEIGVPDLLSQVKAEFERVTAELRRYPGI